MSKRLAAQTLVIVLGLSLPLWAQRGGGGGGGAGSLGQRQGTMGQQRGPMMDRSGPSAQERLRIRASDQQRVQYRSLTAAMNRVRTRAREMARLAKRTGGSYEQFRAQYVELQNEFERMREQHEDFVDGLSDEQEAATKEREKGMAKDLDELNVWMEAMDDELKQSEPDAKKLEKQARQAEKAAKNLQDGSRRLAQDLSID
jgi:chromosome segregation ATPase